MVVRFGQVELDLQAFELRREGRPVHVEPQVFEVVRYLVTHRLVPKEELLEQVWGTRFVSSRPTSRIKTARRVLGDDGREQSVIRTVHGRGYRFVAPVVMEDRDAADGAVATRRADVPPQSESSGAVLRAGGRAGRARRGRRRREPVAARRPRDRRSRRGKTTLVRAMASARGRGHVLSSRM